MYTQGEMPVLGSVDTSIVAAPEDLVALCRTKADAYRLTMNLSRVKRLDKEWARLLNKVEGVSMSTGRLSQILNPETNERRYMPPEAEMELVRLSGNTALAQWVIMGARNQLRHQVDKEKRRAELRAELDELDRTA